MTTLSLFNTPIYFEESADAGGAAPDLGAPPPADDGTPPVPPEGGTPTPPEADPDDGTIPEALRPYVTKLREEAASHRVKAKTAEKMGALGRREGIACHAVVLLRRGG